MNFFFKVGGQYNLFEYLWEKIWKGRDQGNNVEKQWSKVLEKGEYYCGVMWCLTSFKSNE